MGQLVRRTRLRRAPAALTMILVCAKTGMIQGIVYLVTAAYIFMIDRTTKLVGNWRRISKGQKEKGGGE